MKKTQKKELFTIGKNYFVRTVTYHIVGKLIGIKDNFLLFSDASWIADSGRFMNFIKEGTTNEVEPVGYWFVHISSIVDGGEWKHELPKEQK